MSCGVFLTGELFLRSRGNFIICMHLPFSSTLNFIFVAFETACCVEFCSPANECLLQSITIVHASEVYILRQTTKVIERL